MTPSEVADLLHQYAIEAEVSECPEIAGDLDSAAATIRELEAGRAKWEAGDGLDGSVVHAVREVLNRANVPTVAFIDDHVALLVHQRDASEAKLKIATEALEKIGEMSPSVCETSLAHDMAQVANETLARIKETK